MQADGFKEDKNRLDFSIWANLALTLFEFAAGTLANSTAVISLASHDFSDVITTLVARAAVSQAEKPANARKTFGYYRVTVLAALASSLVLLALTLYVIYEGIQRLTNPVHVDVGILTAVSLASMAVNGVITYRLMKKNADLNLQAAFWHSAGDVLGGFAVLAVAIITILFDWHYADGIATILISFIVLKGIYGILKEITGVFMEATPSGMDLSKVEKEINKIKGVEAVHDLHAWTIGAGIYCLSAHVQVKDGKLGNLAPLVSKVKKMLGQKFGITHATIELECVDCQIKGI